MGERVVADSIGRAWERSLGLFDPRRDLLRFDSQRGPCYEVPDVLIEAPVDHGAGDLSPLYPADFGSLVDSYASGFLNQHPGERSTVADRLYRWPSPAKGSPGLTDQVDRAQRLLRESPHSRFNILGFWDPSRDPLIDNPVSPLCGNLRLRDGSLHGTLVARTVDAWLGGFPMFVGFTRLLRTIATAVDAVPARVSFLVLSYHVYEMDLPIVRAVAARVHGA